MSIFNFHDSKTWDLMGADTGLAPQPVNINYENFSRDFYIEIWNAAKIRKEGPDKGFPEEMVEIQEINPPYAWIAKRVDCPENIVKIILENGYEYVCSADQGVYACHIDEYYKNYDDYDGEPQKYFFVASQIDSEFILGKVKSSLNYDFRVKECIPYIMKNKYPFYEFESNYGFVNLRDVSFSAKKTDELTELKCKITIYDKEYDYSFKDQWQGGLSW